MRKCPIRNECPFYKDQVPETQYSNERRMEIRKVYCSVGSTQCARFLVGRALGNEKVPLHLFPDQLFKVNVILGIN